MLWALIRITEGNLYFGHETSLSQCLFLPKQRASVVNEEKKHENIFVFFFTFTRQAKANAGKLEA